MQHIYVTSQLGNHRRLSHAKLFEQVVIDHTKVDVLTSWFINASYRQ
jgi:hypothetical protein